MLFRSDFEALTPHLEGPSAIAVSKDDATAPARVIVKFAKDAPKLELKAGVIEGVLYDAKGIADVAKIPGREELLSRLLGSLQSPVANFARVLNQIAEKGPDAAAPAEAPAAEAPAAEAEAPAAEAEEAAAEAPAAEEEAKAEEPAEETPATETE